MSGSTRDRAVERLLAVPTDVSRGAVGPCVDAEAVAAWLDGGLSGVSADRFESHVAACASCQQLLAVVVRATPAEAPAARAPRWGWARWAVPCAAAAVLVLAVWATWPGSPRGADRSTQANEARVARLEPPELREEPVPRAEVPPGVTADGAKPGAPGKAGAALPPAVLERGDRDFLRSSRVGQVPKVEEKTTPASPAAAAEASRPRADATIQPAEANAAPSRRAADTTALSGAAARARQLGSGLDVQSPNGESRWRVGTAVEFSSDGGMTWRSTGGIATSQIADIVAGASPTPQTAWLVGRRGLVIVTLDGVRFEVRSPPATVDLVAVQAADRLTAVVRALTGQSWRTADGGRTWDPVP